MRVGILSDIHGNLEALQAVQSRCEADGADQIYCLGDVVGYGADPIACVELIEKIATFTCAGNHDWAVVGRIDTSGFNRFAADAIAWTRTQLSREHVDLLDALPLTDWHDDVLFVHGSPYEPLAFHYIYGASDAAFAISQTDARLTFVGHSHRAFIYQEDEGEVVAREGCVRRKDEFRYLVNVGSVGQPRDRDPRAAFCLWDVETGDLELVRVPYEIARTQAKIKNQGLPEFLAKRLSSGS